MGVFAGLDWAANEHAVCVVDDAGAVVAQFVVEHTEAGLREAVRRLSRLSVVSVAIERPNGLVVDALVEAEFTVVPIHPNVVKATRPRYSTTGGKSDRGDAYLLADLLRTDGHRFRPLKPLSDETKALRALVRARDELVAERVALANQLRSLVEGFWPGAACIFHDIDSPIALEFLRKYPTPQAAERLGERRLAGFLAKNAYTGRRSPAELLARLREAPTGYAAEVEAAAKGEAVLAFVSVLKTLVARIKKLTAAVEHAIETHPDGQVFMSFPRAGKVNAAQLLAEIGDVRARFDCADHLAAEAGVTPVTFESGKHRGVGFRWACNKHLRRAVTTWAANSRFSSTWAADIYARARARGKDHPHAVRILARAWLRVLWRCWQDGAPYDQTAHPAAAALAA